MRIGFDFDGVILDTERWIKYYADYYSYFELGGKLRKLENTLTNEDCFDWTPEETKYFYDTYYIKASKTAPFMPGAKEILKKLKEEGHELFVISARNNTQRDEPKYALKRLKELGIKLDGYSFGSKNKGEACMKLGFDMFVDDNPDNVKTFLDLPIQVLFFKDVKISDCTGTNIKKIDTWFDIYLETQKLQKKLNNSNNTKSKMKS